MKTIGGIEVIECKFDGEEFDVVEFDKVPEEYKEEFGKWMYGQTMPVVEGYRSAIYAWDWERWFNMKTKGKPTYFD